MFYKKIYLFLLLIFSFAVSLHKIYGTEPFEENAQFRRTAAQSPIFLEYHQETDFHDKVYSGKRPGFKIFTYDEKVENRKEVGYIIVANMSMLAPVLDISWLRIKEEYQGKGYATEAIRTVMGVYRVRQPKFFPRATHFFFSTGETNKAMIKIAQKLGFASSEKLPYIRGMLRFEKLITDKS